MSFRIFVSLVFTLVVTVSGCDIAQQEDEPIIDENCQIENILTIEDRKFKMGFSTWTYGPETSDLEQTYQFIEGHADIYSEQIDEYIPWRTLILEEDLPASFIENLDKRLFNKPGNAKMILSVSLLNTSRTDLLEDKDGYIPEMTINSKEVTKAYTQYLIFLVKKMNPDYLVMSMEVNELYEKNKSLWEPYKELMHEVKSTMRETFPALILSESMTLHNLFGLEVEDPITYQEEMFAYLNTMDFAAISFYPFFNNLHTKREFQRALDYLSRNVSIPIGITETGHLAEDLVIPAFQTNIMSSECEQNEYLETLLTTAQEEGYNMVIWWTHRDYDALWNTFPASDKDLGKIWRDTGLLDEGGTPRMAAKTWDSVLGER